MKKRRLTGCWMPCLSTCCRASSWCMGSDLWYGCIQECDLSSNTTHVTHVTGPFRKVTTGAQIYCLQVIV